MLDEIPVVADLDDSPARLAGRAVGVLLTLAGVAVAAGALALGGSGVYVGGGLAAVGLLSAGVPAIPALVGRGVVDLAAWLVFEAVWRLVAGLVGALLDGV